MTNTIHLDYPLSPEVRYGYGKPPHQQLLDLIERRREQYGILLSSFLELRESLAAIDSSSAGSRRGEPSWENPYLPVLDAVSLYCMTALGNPRLYIEVGSGVSTQFVRRAIRDHGLRTKILSIDPNPRQDVSDLCDVAIRLPLEASDLTVFSDLLPEDIVFIDGSHRVFQNSDTTVAFLDVIPTLKPGVKCAVHDIYLPWDYPAEWRERYYSEQYLLGAYVLGKGASLPILLPNFYITHEAPLRNVLQPIWTLANVQALGFPHGEAFWFEIS